MNIMWKRLQDRVKGRRTTSAKQDIKDVAEEAVKQQKQKPTKEAKSPLKQRHEENYNTEEMKDVLALFNKLEELVIEGDPRVRDVLNQRPLIQQALMDEGEITDRSEISPRIVPKLQLSPHREPTYLREESGVSGRLAMYKDKQLTVSDLGVRSPKQQRYTQNRFQSNNPIFVSQTIPENAQMNNVYNISNYAGGRMRKHPDGTLLTATNAPAIVDGRINDVNPTFIRSEALLLDTHKRENPQLKTEEIPKLDLHEFNYDTPRGKSKVQVQMRGDDKTHNFNYTNPDAGYQVRVSLDNMPELKNRSAGVKQNTDITQETNPPKTFSTSQGLTIPMPSKREPLFAKRGNNSSWMDIVSKVFTSDGGEISCSGCKLEVPKNAVPNKALIRISLLDIQEVPHTTFGVSNERNPSLLPISAAVKIEPENLVLQKPVTIRLQTSIAMRSDGQSKVDERSKNTQKKLKVIEEDIEAKNVIIQHKNSLTGDLWQKLGTNVFRSSDSVIFKTQELSSFCAFHIQDGTNNDVLIKKIAIYVFQSLERRKKQFLSVLVCEDQPHVLQKGVESMPGWLHYMDSCFNIATEEGRNLVIFLEPIDRTLCSIDTNKMEIPWENLWRPECLIRKHFTVTLHKLDTEGFIQLVVNEANYRLNTSFIWQVQKQQIFLPDPVPVETYALDEDRAWKYDLEPKPRDYSNLYKHVTWKPPTPEPQLVTNESLLRYATM
ncbi:uncharacterized protein LOC120346597 [Styela clava]